MEVVDATPQVVSAEDPGELERTHPLEHEWTFWYDKRLGGGAGMRVKGERHAYESNLKEIGTFGTVEDFWRHYNYMVKPSLLENNSNYHFFKKGVKPMWEDPLNVRGGKWIIQLKKNKGQLDARWENMVLGMVGETLEVESEVCGAVVSRRKNGDKIALWLRGTSEVPITSVGRKIKEQLGIGPEEEIAYQIHADAMRSGASYRNLNRYVC
eukprot:TRINITY_DN1746_c0_g1_i1.p1 TRINITY_DN1746_c0_g1~~TRINITY_DN1746_c0_g1_i1.p1  ORF type:complete len:211 (-),score=23.77 TRINITY_DN1746_c0_g1_i1:231-863(-)